MKGSEKAMRYRMLLMAAVPGLAGLLSVQPAAAPRPEAQPTAAQIDAALASARLDAGIAPRVR